MGEMSSTIVCPGLFKQIASKRETQRHRDQAWVRRGGGRTQESVLRIKRLCFIQSVCIVNNWRRLSRKWGDKGQ